MNYDPYRFEELETLIRVHFRNKDLLNNAFVHRSFVNEYKEGPLESNERLEFLGDAVLELVVTEFLYKNYPNPEGELTNWRSALVRGANLAIIARKIDLGKYLYLSKGEKKTNGFDKDYILANTTEALIGAIYLDQGYEVAHQFIDKFILIYLDKILKEGLHLDAKSRFQEAAQEKMNITPTYELLKEEGPDHNKTFWMGVYLNEELVAEGQGKNKQSAEQEAAEKALRKKKWGKAARFQ